MTALPTSEPLPAPVNVAAVAARGLPVPVEACLQAAMDGQPLPSPEHPWRLEATSVGGRVLWELPAGNTRPRRWAAWSRGERLSHLLHWAPSEVGGALLRADVSCPGGRWAQLLPASATQALWGTSDRLCFGPPAHPAAGDVLLPAQDFAALACIPPVDRPARLPRGVGSAVLNLLATLMVDQGLAESGYRGPYPTPALFDALCGCFTPIGDAAAARDAFTEHAVAIAFSGEMVDSPVRWRPQPWEAVVPSDDVLLQWRDGPRVLWLGELAFPRCGSRQPLPLGRRLWPAPAAGGPAYRAGLVFLGQPYGAYAALRTDGSLDAVSPPPAPADSSAAARPLGHALAAAMFAWAKVGSTAALAPALVDLSAEWHPVWDELGAELAIARPPLLRLNGGMAEQFRRLAAANDPGPLAMMLVSDVCQAAMPALAGLAQVRLNEARPPPEPNALMHAGRQIQAQAQAELARTLPALVAALARGEGLVER